MLGTQALTEDCAVSVLATHTKAQMALRHAYLVQQTQASLAQLRPIMMLQKTAAATRAGQAPSVELQLLPALASRSVVQVRGIVPSDLISNADRA